MCPYLKPPSLFVCLISLPLFLFFGENVVSSEIARGVMSAKSKTRGKKDFVSGDKLNWLIAELQPIRVSQRVIKPRRGGGNKAKYCTISYSDLSSR